MYSPANFAPLSQASLKRLMKGHTVRVKHGTGLQLGLSKMQMKKHMASKKKGQGGYNMTFDPYQSQMHGQGFFEDVGNAFKQLGNSFVENVAKPVGREIVSEGKRQGRKVASRLIHEGIPIASKALGGIAGKTLGGLTEIEGGEEAGENIGKRFGEFGGKKLADYVGQQTGYGMKQIMMTPQMKKAMKPRLLEGGTLLIDQPFTAREAVNTTGNFFKDPKGTLGFGMKKRGRPRKGGTLLIDQPFTAREAVNTTGNFFKDPKGTLGFGNMPTIPNQYKGRGRMGGTLLIDQPFTAREAVNTTGDFFKNPKGTLGFGMHGRPRKGGALLQAGYYH